MKVRSAVLAIAFLVFGFQAWRSSIHAADWPTYRADPARTGYSKETLPSGLSNRWVYRSAPAQSAWPSSNRQLFDRAAHPVVADGDAEAAAQWAERKRSKRIRVHGPGSARDRTRALVATIQYARG